jgi:uncharacterized membrane protein YhaH (DUF805 family)
MTAGVFFFLIGLYVFPLVLLWWGHHLKRRSRTARRAFWGAIIGHCVAGVLALSAGILFPEEWDAQERLRGLLGLWSLMIFPVAGAFAAVLLPSRAS